MKTRVHAAAIIEKDNEILLGMKPKNVGPYPNTWHLLGGGVNEGEDLIAAVKREVLEEGNIEIDNIELVSVDEDEALNKNNELTHYVFNVYKCRYKDGELRPGDDIVELKWFPLNELKNIPLASPSIKLFKKLKFI